MKRYPSGIMATCCIPWDVNGQFAEAIFRRGVRAAITRGTKQLYIFGTAGEGYAVTERQFDQIVAAFAHEMRQGSAEPMVGVINLAWGTICERIERCRDQGVKHFQISLPSWGALAERELFRFFDGVCGRFPDCQFMHYNLPRTKRMVTGKEYGRLAAAHPNLVATKNCGDSQSHLRSLMEDAPPLQHFLSEAGYVYGSLFGECGILASFIMNWPRIKALWEAGRRRDVATMVSIQREVDIVIQTLNDTIPDERIDGSYDKLFEKMYDPDMPLRLLPPYIGSSDEEYHAFVKLLGERLPEWVPTPVYPVVETAVVTTVRGSEFGPEISMNLLNTYPAIDVHGHYGTYIGESGDRLVDGFYSGDAAEVVRRATAVHIVLTIVSPLTALKPRFQADSVAGNIEAARVVADTPGLKQYVVIDPLRPQTYAQAEEMLAQPQCVGIKLHPEEHGYVIRDHARPIFEFAARHRAIVLTHSSEKNSLAADFVPWANEFPEVRLILAHIGCGRDGDLTHQVRAIQQTRHANVFADTSSARSITPGLIEWAVREVGVDRVLFGTDTPLYHAAMQRARIEHADLPDDAKRQILRDNALRLFGAKLEMSSH